MMERKVYIYAKAKPNEKRRHTRFSCVQQHAGEYEYVTEAEAIERGYTMECKKCQKPKSRKGATK